MKILFIGGTGTISYSCAKRFIEAGYDLTILCRGTRNQRLLPGASVLIGDAYLLDEKSSQALAVQEWDCVINWTIYNSTQAQMDVDRFKHNTKKYFYISTTSVYDESNRNALISETQAYLNTDWFYSKSKIEAERLFLEKYRELKFPVTIIRPGHTYNDFTVPTNIQGLGYSLILKINANEKILMHDDGNSMWTLTHSDDFANYFFELVHVANIEGEIFHITSDEFHTWNEIYDIYSQLLGKKLNKVYMPTKDINSKSPSVGEPIQSDKMLNRIFDNSKIKNYIKTSINNIPLHDGLSRVLSWYKQHQHDIRINQYVEYELAKLTL